MLKNGTPSSQDMISKLIPQLCLQEAYQASILWRHFMLYVVEPVDTRSCPHCHTPLL